MRRVRVGDRVEYGVIGIGDVIRADGAGVSVSFDAAVLVFDAAIARRFLCIVGDAS